jgi:hypothetical protein
LIYHYYGLQDQSETLILRPNTSRSESIFSKKQLLLLISPKGRSRLADRLRFLFDVPQGYFFYAFKAPNDDFLAAADVVVKDDPAIGD